MNVTSKSAPQAPRRASYQHTKSPSKGERGRTPQVGGLKQPSTKQPLSRAVTPTSDAGSMASIRAQRRPKQRAGDLPEASADSTAEVTVSETVPRPLPQRRSRKRSQHLAHLALATADSSANETEDERNMPALSNLSISAPSGSSRDVWEMPKQAAERKEALNWQQSLSSQAPTPIVGFGKPSRKQMRPKPIALSDSVPVESAVGDALTWQQELLRGAAPRSGPSGSAFDWPQTASQKGVNNSPVKQKKKRVVNDAIQTATPGANFEPFELDDVFANNSTSSSKPAKSPALRSGANSAPPARQRNANLSTDSSTAVKTPTVSLEPARYAGPAFSNSPSPHLLPTPTRLIRRNEAQP